MQLRISPSMASKKLSQEEFIRKCKTPLIKWKEFQTRLPTVEEVSRWFDQSPAPNIGIVTGEISNLVVFDLDSKSAEDFAESEGGFPDTVKVKTGKGYHVYMKHPGFKVENDVRKEYDIDIRGDGGYVVAPPSKHGSGNHYEWVDGFSLSEIDPADHVPWTIEYLEAYATKAINPGKEPPTKASKTLSKDSTAVTPDPYMEIMANGAQQGERNYMATKLIGHLLGKGNNENVAWEILKQWNDAKNRPPMDGQQLREIFDSIRDLERKNGKKKPEKKEIDVSKFLDNEKRVTAEYDEQYVRTPDYSFESISQRPCLYCA